ncbi:predicted protein [Sclerotinia sclerotiorum 1980 UF-70]|uniref:SET domain-containing protein n=2 Tax=Sclerotinia sclerotiorum (strain ATCC 18683 / 1980 / Ss-1) TaxID=665079 RepID=A0A1D9QIM7_SCLS1|nr:predicted protein [Sclerotinia sclerotiorum 1980 UF-70]APA14788.1 hypothetical protein sscle_13g095580 [Sclerotinia sclerotiorum 1980 UF-70]EDO04326.1 predicted protein [Sclerotinia sclerotiorum 1980 UF-70]
MPISDETKWIATEMGKVFLRPYPWASEVNTRTKESIELANKYVSKCSKVLRIKPSTVDISGSDKVSYGEKCFPSAPEISKLIWLRLLATCKQGVGPPLQHPLMAHFISHEAQADDPWSLETRVITPLKILHMLGVDIFADKCFDTWILETLWQRFRFNAVGGLGEDNEYECWVDGSYAMFNHSCEDPSMLCILHADSGFKFQCRAERDIKKGEEVGETADA